MAEEEDMPPFWLQPNTCRHGRSRRSQFSSIFLSSGLFLTILLVIAFIFVFYAVPSFFSFSTQVLRPRSVKKGWDSLNLVLVLFAIVCGFLGRNNSNNSNINKINNHEGISYYEERHITNVQQDAQRCCPSTPHRWYDQYHDRTTYASLNRLRSFSSYPDLRLESSWLTNDEQWRFHDDTDLNSCRFSSSDRLHYDHHHQEQQQKPKKEGEEESKGIGVDTYGIEEKEVVYTPPLPQPPSPPPSSPPPPLPSKTVRRKVRRTYHAPGHEKRSVEDRDLSFKNSSVPPPSPPPPPPPPLFCKYEKRRGKDFLSNLRRRKKKQRQKSVENLESLFNPEPSITSFIPPPSRPPPPPPPPPPPHFLQILFSSSKGKTKKVLSVPPLPPPSPPPPPTISSASLTRVSKIVAKNVTPPLFESRALRTKATQVAPVTYHNDKPPKQVKTSRLNSMEENVDSGNASPLIPIPPPPPPPPFKMQPWRFLLDGDYVRVQSFSSSRSGSPDLESLEDPSDKELSSPMAAAVDANGGGDMVTTPLFCPSPDVNTKADNFIARFKAGLRMEKVNSVKGRSNLGPE